MRALMRSSWPVASNQPAQVTFLGILNLLELLRNVCIQIHVHIYIHYAVGTYLYPFWYKLPNSFIPFGISHERCNTCVPRAPPSPSLLCLRR